MTSPLADLYTAFQSEIIQQDSLPDITANRLREMINNGKLSPGTQLPNELDLAQLMGVSRGTMRTALNILQEQGLIWRRQGIGSFVSEQPILENRLDINSGVTELIESMGLTPGSKILELNLVPADDHHAKQFNIPQGSLLVHLRRLRTASGRPVVSSLDIFPNAILEQSQQHMGLEALRARLEDKLSLYRIFDQDFGINIEYGITRVRPVKVNTHLMKQIGLDFPPGTVMLYLEQLDYDRNRKPVYLSCEYHVADFCTFTIFRR